MRMQVIGKQLKYRGVYHPVGAIVEMDGKHARLFEALDRVCMHFESGPVEPVAYVSDRQFDHPGMDQPMKKRTYKRRDMKAE